MERMKIQDAPASAWTTLAHALVIVDAWDWQALIDARARADSIGHIMDPTGYRDLIHDKEAARNLELAKAVVVLLNKAHETHPELFSPTLPAKGEG